MKLFLVHDWKISTIGGLQPISRDTIPQRTIAGGQTEGANEPPFSFPDPIVSPGGRGLRTRKRRFLECYASKRSHV